MPTVFPFVFAPEDEKQLCGFLAPYGLTVFPERIPPGWKPFPLDAAAASRLDEPAYYFAAEALAEVQMRNVKRGKDRGALEIDERGSPVIHYLRSFVDDEGQLRSGRIWCELNLVGDMQRNPAFPDRFRRMLVALREHLHARHHRSDPPGWFVGPHAARAHKAGTALREEGRKGVLLRPWK